MNSVQFGKSKINYNVKRSSRRKTTEIVVSKTGVKVLTTTKFSQLNKGKLKFPSGTFHLSDWPC